MTFASVAQHFNVNVERGLSERQVNQRLQDSGPNALPKQKATSRVTIFFRQFLSPLMFMLLIAACVSLLLGEFKDSIVILLAVGLNVSVGFIQEWNAEKTARLLQSFEAAYCRVIRAGNTRKISADLLVPGDIVILRAGVRLPADIRLTHVVDFTTDEALLTGESKPIKKNTERLEDECTVGDQNNMAFAGSFVSQGKATGIVVATGGKTQLGQIALLAEQTEQKLTPLQVQINRFSWWLGGIVISITIGVGFICLFRGMLLHQILTVSIALAVAAIPEGLLVSVTAILAIGMYRMLKRKSLIRHLVAAETLGSVSVICTDKTGTLTEGKMRVVRIVTLNHDIDIVKGEPSELINKPEIRELLTACVVNNDASIDPVRNILVGQPTETALYQLACDANLDIPKICDEYKRLHEFPFSSDHKYMATLHPRGDGQWLVVKGAPEKVFAFCDANDHNIERFRAFEAAMSGRGLRLLAVAVARGKEFDVHNIKPQLTCIGLIGIQDPLRAKASHTVETLAKAGIRTVIVTGDHVKTASNIAHQVGLAIGEENVMTGLQLDAMTQEDLNESIVNIDLFARVEPRHKIAIVKAWQACGQAVAMIGDGVNDTPALKAADIGIALGDGSDVAHEISDIVLLNNDLSTIVAAVHEGRTIFENIRKVIVYLLTDSFGVIILIAGALLLGFELPLLASQILWINLISDGFPNLALTVEPPEAGIMQQPPRKKNEPILNREMKVLIFGVGIFTDIVILILYICLILYSSYALDHVRTIIFSTLAINSLFYVFAVKSLKKSIFEIDLLSNRWLLVTVFGGIGIQLLVVYTPFLQKLFSTVPMGIFEWLIVGCLCMIKVVAIEITKYFFIRMNGEK